ncbi:hypothetical protein GCK32_018333 [Trichostrongylus colubriformis]|uniref:Uncharacterized protein n=1 Tax=Trichostrongylus colubriformis TaxID=6319 RepID=A0AAN8ES98_TRICO
MVHSTVLFILLYVSLPFASTIKCYVGEQMTRNGVVEMENMVISECGSSYCVSQEWWSNDVKMVNLFCDRIFVDMNGNYVALCKADGTFTSTGFNNVQCTNKCCSSDYCNRPISSTGPTSNIGIPCYHLLLLLILVILYKNL